MIKSSTKSNISYTGMVTLSQYAGGRKVTTAKIHNTGGAPLFNFITDCLAADFTMAKLSSPYQILLIKTSDNGDSLDLLNATTSDFITILTKPEKIDTNTVRYSFIVPQDAVADLTFNAIGLYPKTATLSDITNYYALCKVKNPTTVSTSSVLVVDWDLTISNGT